MDWETLANELLDRMIDMDGVSSTIDWLLQSGFEANDLILFLGFNGQDVRQVQLDLERE